MTRTSVRLICSAVIQLLVVVPVVHAQQAPPPPPPGKSTGKGWTHANMDFDLARYTAGEISTKDLEHRGYRIADERIQIVLEAESGASSSVAAALALGGAQKISTARHFVQAEVSLDALASVADLPGVLFVRKPNYAVYPEPDLPPPSKALALAQTSEGVAPMNAPAWHGSGQRGGGIKVGVIDISFGGYASLVGSDLPGAGRTHYHAFGSTVLDPDEVHGTACAEIIYDIAPDAEMYLAHIDTYVDFLNAVDWLVTNNVDVVSMSLGWFFPGPGDGTGGMQDEIRETVQVNYMAWFTSAGNSRQQHWQAKSYDSDIDGWVDIAGSELEVNYFEDGYGNRRNFVSEEEIDVRLVWNDWTAVTADYDLHLFRYDETSEELVWVASSEDSQTGGPHQEPTEDLSFEVTTSGHYAFAIWQNDVPEFHDLEVFASAYLDYRNQEGSLGQPSDSPYVVAIAAGDYLSPFGDHSYSSMGPTNGPGGSFTGGLIKPDLMGYAGVSTTSYGYKDFNGTSAACPHAAGGAALVWGANLGWSNSQVRSYLETNAADLGSAGKDNTFGYGRLYLGSPTASCSYSISPTTHTLGSSSGSGSFNVTAPSGCTWTATTSSSWIHITSGSSGSGNGTVTYNVDANPSSSQRSGTIHVADQTFTITQAGVASCSYTISPTSRSFDASGGTDTIAVSTTSGCAWTATPNLSWITVTGGLSGTGSGTVSYRVDANASSSSRTGTLTVAGHTFTVTQSGAASASDYRYLVAGIAHVSGAGGSQWRSTLAVTNRSGAAAHLTLTYRFISGTIERGVGLPNNEIVEWEDVVVTLFDKSGYSSGSVEVASDYPVIVTARTYNESADGTFGQFLPGADQTVELMSGQIGILPQVKKTSAFRCNIGFVNLSAGSCTVNTRLYSASGVQLGNTVTTSMNAGAWKQINDAFAKAGVSSCDLGYATVEVTTGGCSVWAYASIVDNDSGDPTTIPIYVQ